MFKQVCSSKCFCFSPLDITTLQWVQITLMHIIIYADASADGEIIVYQTSNTRRHFKDALDMIIESVCT